MVSLIELPSKPLTIIILKLSVHDITVLKRVNKFLQTFIKESMIIAYGFNIETSGILDNSACPLPLQAKLSYVNRKEHAWNFFKTDVTTKISAFDANTSICATTSTDVFLAKHVTDEESGETKTLGVRYISLPSIFDSDDGGTISWVPMTLNCPVVGFGESVDENDLFALAGLEPDDDDPSLNKIVLILIRASTNEMHDEADSGVLSIGRVPKKNGVPKVNIAISGENMAIAVVTSATKQGDRDVMVILDWKKGEQKGNRFKATDVSLTFLREDILVTANSLRGSLDVYQIPSSAEIALNPPEPPRSPDPLQSTPDYLPPVRVRVIHGFSLPPLSPGWIISSIESSSTPGATPGQTLPKSLSKLQGYTDHPKQAIMVLIINTEEQGNPANKHRFHMIVHRQALVDLVPKDKLSEYENVVEKLKKRKERLSDISAAMAAVGLANQGETEDYSTGPYYMFVPWASWGKEVARWFDADGYVGGFGAISYGQHYVQYEIEEGLEEEQAENTGKGVIHILDFNPYSVRRAWQGLGSPQLFRGPVCTVSIVGIASQKVEQPEENDDGATWEHGENMCDSRGVFVNPLVGRLPYIRVTANNKYDYDGLLINEHSVIGVNIKPGTNHVDTLSAMYIG
ncbi:hypothetical protein CPB83DRAFT_860677 [Crepidotus variabilis]|uniref:F-box domain-containing protein n=1 Tax=Crepidotus variabilis TaxID=179855 RepID=A0A9P6E9D0_9AGAR|nr:hypothetical protein CPB83DRAFT_860677 [Crepidotus variabilis]